MSAVNVLRSKLCQQGTCVYINSIWSLCQGIVIVHDEQRKPMENEKDRDEETHNLKEEHIAYVLELEKTVNDKDRLVITLREEAHAIKIRSEAEISKLKQQLSEEKRSKNVVATSVGSASEIRDYKEHSKKQSQVIHDLKQEIKEFKVKCVLLIGRCGSPTLPYNCVYQPLTKDDHSHPITACSHLAIIVLLSIPLESFRIWDGILP